MKASNLTKETVLSFGLTERNFPNFNVGDTIEVDQLIQEGDKERVQKFIGYVIAFHHNGAGTTFIVRKMASGNIGVEKIFPYYSPTISAIRVVKEGAVRRAKLFYIRGAVGKAAKIKDKAKEPTRRTKKGDTVAPTAESAAETASAA
jgi:large subunit ribosomal protein L19